MASNIEFVKYAVDQMSGAGNIVYRKMFGEFGIYSEGKIFALICDNQLFIKPTDAGREFIQEIIYAAPYEGAKPYFLIDNVDNREFLTELVKITCAALPDSKPKKRQK